VKEVIVRVVVSVNKVTGCVQLSNSEQSEKWGNIEFLVGNHKLSFD